MIPSKNTWEFQLADGGARRPTLADLGGCVLVEDTGRPPAQDGTQPSKVMFEQWQRQLESIGGVCVGARFVFGIGGGGLATFVKARLGNKLLTSADFFLIPNAAGDFTVEWLTWKIPIPDTDPMPSVTDLTIAKPSIVAALVVASDPVNRKAFQVKTRSDGVLTGMTCQVWL